MRLLGAGSGHGRKAAPALPRSRAKLSVVGKLADGIGRSDVERLGRVLIERVERADAQAEHVACDRLAARGRQLLEKFGWPADYRRQRLRVDLGSVIEHECSSRWRPCGAALARTFAVGVAGPDRKRERRPRRVWTGRGLRIQGVELRRRGAPGCRAARICGH